MIRVSDIQDAVAEHYHLPVTVMREPSGPGKNAHRIAHPRQVAMFLAVEFTDHSLYRIGQLFGGRDRTTVMFAMRQVERRILKYGPSRFAVEKLTARFDERKAAERGSAELRDAILRCAA